MFHARIDIASPCDMPMVLTRNIFFAHTWLHNERTRPTSQYHQDLDGYEAA